MKLPSILLISLALSGGLKAAEGEKVMLPGIDKESALDFLYRYMPQPDSADYSQEFWARNVAYSLKAREEMPWGKSVPEREWKHFVLPVRVNNENLDEARMVMYEALKNRVKGLTMKEAVLEVNHWCHEHVTYIPSDSRTSAPLATMRNAKGRCGEESTFCVAALRSVGIPARQVYTPRWAHTDDNHAWVEAWVDGTWHFIGACEPEPVLDLAWFNAPASRAMLMHTKVFGHYDGPETVMQETACYTEIDVTANYAPTARVKVRTVDAEGRPISAKVEFKLYNYAEFYTLATKQSDANGTTDFAAGLGDLVVWASSGRGDEARYGFAKCSMGKQDEVTVKLDRKQKDGGSFDLDIVPPAERNNMPVVSEEQRMENQRRLAREDSIRTAYEGKFKHDNWAVEASRGNYSVIRQFYTGVNDEAMATKLLSVISAKDLHDVTLDVLMDSYMFTLGTDTTEVWSHYVYNPRVCNEMLTAYKRFFQTEMPKDLVGQCQKDYTEWTSWVKEHISIDNTRNPQQLCMSPESVWRVRKTDTHSRDIFYVAVARSMGLASRIDEVTGKVQVYDKGAWNDVQLDAAKEKGNAPQGRLKAKSACEGQQSPDYYTHFTLSKMVDGAPQLLTYPEDGSVTWKNTFGEGEEMDEGTYLMVSGTRLANGGVLTHLEFLPIEDQKTTQADLTMRESKEEVAVIGSFNSENLYRTETGEVKSLLSTTGRGYYVVALIAPGQEPTNHALRDIAAVSEQLETWERSLILLFQNEEEKARFTNRSEFKNLPRNLVFGTDVDHKIHDEMWANMYLSAPTLPVFLIADTFNRVVWCKQGYTIGLGQQMLDVIKRL